MTGDDLKVRNLWLCDSRWRACTALSSQFHSAPSPDSKSFTYFEFWFTSKPTWTHHMDKHPQTEMCHIITLRWSLQWSPNLCITSINHEWGRKNKQLTKQKIFGWMEYNHIIISPLNMAYWLDTSFVWFDYFWGFHGNKESSYIQWWWL